MFRQSPLLLVFVFAIHIGCDSQIAETDGTGPGIAQHFIRGRVVDTNGQPMHDVDVATLWSANGQQWNDDGSFPEPATDEVVTAVWNNEGEMEPFPNHRGSLAGDGTFVVAESGNESRVVFAINRTRTLGGIGYAGSKLPGPLQITLVPLVRVTGEIRCDGKTPEWTYACIYPGDVREVPD